ncbi:ovate family protein [Striga asiatica]|uniref:Transcription repressor n=1 Tax=Striga asiatica TaxID=4170 RepID=A0A5A7R4N0_STRAF|nr:ovate family protein [Striga asiatica]
MSKQTQKFSCTSASQKIKISSKQIQPNKYRASKHLNTADGEGHKSGGANLPDNARLLLENFKSLYEEDFHREKATIKEQHAQSILLNRPEGGNTLAPPPKNFSGENSEAEKGKEEIEADDFIAILKYSPSPYREFRRSMAEMVEVRLGRGGKVDWDFLEELLFRYLDLNNEKAHRNVLRAFVDLVVVLHENDWRSPERHRRPWDGVGGGGGRLLKGEM